MSLNVQILHPNLLGTANDAGQTAISSGEISRLKAMLLSDKVLNDYNLNVVINAGGDFVAMSPQELAQEVHSGTVWIDWCGWPLSQGDQSAFGFRFDENFQTFATACDVGMSYKGGPVSFSAIPNGWPYARSLCTTGPTTGSGFRGSFESMHTVTSENEFCWSSFAILYGKGAYLWAFGHESYGLFSGSAHVTFEQYWPFIKEVLMDLVGERLTHRGAPSCPDLGQYVGHTSDGFFVFEKPYGGGILRSTATYGCTVTSQTMVEARGAAGGASPTSARGGCSRYGEYLGTGNDFGASAAYSVYRSNSEGGYTLSVVDDATCSLINSYYHAFASGSGETPAKTGASTRKSSTPGFSTSPVPGTAPEHAVTQPAGLSNGDKVALGLGAAAIAAGAGWYLWTRRSDVRE